MKKFTSIILVAFLLVMLSISANAKDFDSTTYITESFTVDSFSGEQLENVENLHISPAKISFTRQGKAYSFGLTQLDIDTSDGQNVAGGKFFSGSVGDLVCNVVEYNQRYCVQIINKAENEFGRKRDNNNNFTIICGENSSSNQTLLSNTIKQQNQHVESGITTMSNQLHVYVSGVSVPFLISGGSAEGWCTATYIGNDNYQVSSLQYSVAYNWPSDGVSLWYDSLNSSSAFRSPAWPSSALTSVSGTWVINKYKGSFMAEATVSAAVKGVPVMWTLYDTCYMDGTHQ